MRRFCSSLTLLAIAFCYLHTAVLTEAKRCKSIAVPDQPCSNTNFESYMECMRRRTKRDVDCEDCDGDSCEEDSCSNCNCNYCSYNECDNSCNACCASVPPPCSTRSCCQNTCHSQCKTVSCRRSCRSKCQNKIQQKPSTSLVTGWTGGGSGSSQSQSSLKNDDKHNITTIINLHNVINNTNVVDIPVHVNNTNVNNITVESADVQPSPISISTHGSNQQQPTPIQTILYPQQPTNVPTIQPQPPSQPEPPSQPNQENCCKIIGPRQCVPTSQPPFMHCFHYRRQHCGSLCQTGIMHAEPHQVCDQSQSQPRCHQQVAYIPQPQPRCSYTSSWPYVSCSAPNMAQANCGGCYKHLIHGGNPPSDCSSNCYDGGYDVGPMYRMGPVYQPPISAYPPCMYTGTCGNAMGYGQPSMINPFESGFQLEGNDINKLPSNKRHVSENRKHEKESETVNEDKKEEKKVEDNVV